MIVPTQNAREAATADGPLVYGVSTLQEAVEILEGDVRQRPYELSIDDVFREHGSYSVAGILAANQALVATRPFRIPHHTISELIL